MDVTVSNEKVSEIQRFLVVNETTEKYNLIKNVVKTKELLFLFKVRPLKRD